MYLVRGRLEVDAPALACDGTLHAQEERSLQRLYVFAGQDLLNLAVVARVTHLIDALTHQLNLQPDKLFFSK